MSDFKQKLLSAGLGAAVLLGACAPLTAMAAQKRRGSAPPLGVSEQHCWQPGPVWAGSGAERTFAAGRI